MSAVKMEMSVIEEAPFDAAKWDQVEASTEGQMKRAAQDCQIRLHSPGVSTSRPRPAVSCIISPQTLVYKNARTWWGPRESP